MVLKHMKESVKIPLVLDLNSVDAERGTTLGICVDYRWDFILAKTEKVVEFRNTKKSLSKTDWFQFATVSKPKEERLQEAV